MKRISWILLLTLALCLMLLPAGVQALGEQAAEEPSEALAPPEETLPAETGEEVVLPEETEAPEAEPTGETSVSEAPAEAPAAEEAEPAPTEELPAAPAEETTAAEEPVPAEEAPTEAPVAPVEETDSAPAPEGTEEAPAGEEAGLSLDGAAAEEESVSPSDAEVIEASPTDAGDLLATPKLPAVKATTGGVKVSWSAVSGAEKYRVFRRTASGSWTKVGDTTGTSLVDSKAKSGTKYYYTVRCVSSDGKKAASDYNTTGKAITYLAAPKVTKVSNVTKGVKVTWNKVTGATGYYVYRKTAGGSWKKIATVKSGSTLTYTDTKVKAKSGTKYWYTVRAYKGSATSSYYTSGKAILRLANPTLVSVTSGNAGKATVKWKKVTGASGYYIYRKTAGSGWKKVGTVKKAAKVSFVDSKAASGTKYTYMVRAYKGSTLSYYNTGKTVTIK